MGKSNLPVNPEEIEKVERFSLVKGIITALYLARRQTIPDAEQIDAEAAIAVQDWEGISNQDLLTCSKAARQTPKFGQITNRDLLVEYEKLKDQRAQEKRRIENKRLLEGPDERPATPEEVREICQEWKKISINKAR